MKTSQTSYYVPAAITDDGHLLAECFAVCHDTDGRHSHTFHLTLDDARAVALDGPNPRIALVSVDLTRGDRARGELLVMPVLGSPAS